MEERYKKKQISTYTAFKKKRKIDEELRNLQIKTKQFDSRTGRNTWEKKLKKKKFRERNVLDFTFLIYYIYISTYEQSHNNRLLSELNFLKWMRACVCNNHFQWIY